MNLEWAKTTERPPVMQDANWLGRIIATLVYGDLLVPMEVRWETVAQFPEKYPYWMSHPSVPEMEEV